MESIRSIRTLRTYFAAQTDQRTCDTSSITERYEETEFISALSSEMFLLVIPLPPPPPPPIIVNRKVRSFTNILRFHR